jgi:predicted dinucleotide-binding enzyme
MLRPAASAQPGPSRGEDKLMAKIVQPADRIGRRALLGALPAVVLALPSRAAPSKSLKIGIIGAGRIGGNLARLWAAAGYQVMLSARDLGPVRKLAAEIGTNALAGTPRQAAAFGDVVVVSVPYGAIVQIGRDYAAELKGKIVLDTCNPKGRDYLALTPQEKALGSGVLDQRKLPGTRLVKAFNTIRSTVLLSAAHRAGEPAGVPLAADDKRALAVARRLVLDAGYEPVMAGDLKAAQIFDSYTPFHTTGMPASQVRKLLKEKPAPVFTD